MTCPSRMSEAGPWEKEEGLDGWREGTDAWDNFPWHWIPRRCSFCGSLNPDDALRLLSEGWTEEKATGKRYKAYFNPPADHTAMRRGLGSDNPDQPKEKSVMPKLYMWHLSEAQLKEMNDIHFGGPA